MRKSASPATTELDIYTPPGYATSPDRHYPVLYAVPFDYSLWDSSLNIRVVLDTLIDSDDIPPMVVAFVSAAHAPLPDTECANSVDGRQWMDTFISETVVSYVDSHYLTIARPEARATTGFSPGRRGGRWQDSPRADIAQPSFRSVIPTSSARPSHSRATFGPAMGPRTRRSHSVAMHR